jgi:phosphatidylserine/phosphatidylglycerophosphate/cardiolipin synthase-like enzyme
MRNDRLREAISALGIRINDLGPAVGVNAKTAQRWVYEGRIPRRNTADRVSHHLGVPVDWLWPQIDGDENRIPTDLVRLYPHRLDAPRQLWLELIRGARSQIDILGIAGLFLIEDNSGVIGLLKRKAEAGVRVRIALTDPDSTALRRRSGEEMLYDALVSRAEMARDAFDPLFTTTGVEYRPHTATVYASIFRFDEQMLVNHHLFGIYGYLAPLMHLQRADEGGLFDMCRASFDRVWHLSGSPIL